MACRLLRRSTNSVTSIAVNGVRHFSSYDEPKAADGNIVIKIVSRNDSSFQWPDTRLGPLEPKDHRFPFPGLVGSGNLQLQHIDQMKPRKKTPQYDVDVLVAELPHERQSSVFEQFMTVNKEMNTIDNDHAKSANAKLSALDRLECAAFDCPFLLRKDFFEMFPSCHIHPLDSLTVVTFCHKSDAAAEKSSKNLVADIQVDFLTAATNVCQELHSNGYWADFIDPMSCRPYLDVQTNAAFYEVDERYRRFGFEIDDSTGRCRVLRHHAFGTRPFVGCVFTNAPIGHPVVADLSRSRNGRPAAN